jgi:hypothetical protein
MVIGELPAVIAVVMKQITRNTAERIWICGHESVWWNWRSTSMAETITWVTPSHTRPGKPKWLATAGMSSKGTVFLPARVVGNESAVFLAASWDGTVEAAIYRGHAFLPVDWLAEEYPAAADDLRVVEQRVREAFRNNGETENPSVSTEENDSASDG